MAGSFLLEIFLLGLFCYNGRKDFFIMTKTKKHFYRGFTLIELLIVVAILGILAVIVLVGLRNGKQKSQNTSAFSTMQSISTFAQRCLLEGQNINVPSVPSSGGSNPGNVMCPLYPDTYPDITKTGFLYHSNAFISNSTTGQFAFTAHSQNSTAKIVCGSNIYLNNWYGLTWDFRDITACKTTGF